MPESQKKRPEEDFENKKLLGILQDVFYLVTDIEKRNKKIDREIKRLNR